MTATLTQQEYQNLSTQSKSIEREWFSSRPHSGRTKQKKSESDINKEYDIDELERLSGGVK